MAIPIFLEPGWSHSWVKVGGGYEVNVIGLWGVLVFGRWIWQTFRVGKKKAQWNTYWIRRALNFAGNIGETAEYILARRAKGGRPISPERIQAGILQQIADLTRELTDISEEVTIQACLLVPEHDATKHVVALRTITYNRLSGSRNHSVIPLGVPGAVTEAFRKNSVRVIPDTMEPEYRAQFEGRPYRSVAAFPVNIGSGEGKKTAIVSVDATRPHVFSDDVLVEHGIEDAISPFVKLLGLLLVAGKGTR